MLSSGREETSRLPAAGCLSSHPGLKSAFSFGRAGPVARRSPPFHRPGKPRGGTGRTLSVPARGGMRGGRPHPLLPLGRKHPRTARGAAAARMAAKARSGARVCFIGSCAAKKPETSRSSLPSDGDCVLPFGELQGMFDAPEVDLSAVERALGGFPAGSAAGPGFAAGGCVAAAVAQRMDEMASGRRIPIRYGDGLRGAEGCRPWPGTERITAAFRMAWVAAGGCVAGTGSIRPGKAAAGRVAAYQAAARRRSPRRARIGTSRRRSRSRKSVKALRLKGRSAFVIRSYLLNSPAPPGCDIIK